MALPVKCFACQCGSDGGTCAVRCRSTARMEPLADSSRLVTRVCRWKTPRELQCQICARNMQGFGWFRRCLPAVIVM